MEPLFDDYATTVFAEPTSLTSRSNQRQTTMNPTQSSERYHQNIKPLVVVNAIREYDYKGCFSYQPFPANEWEPGTDYVPIVPFVVDDDTNEHKFKRMTTNVMTVPPVPGMDNIATMDRARFPQSRFLALPLAIKHLIFAFYFEDTISDDYRNQHKVLVFNDQGACITHPKATLTARDLRGMLELLRVNKQYYIDATNVLYAFFLPHMVTHIASLAEFAWLERKLLRRCPHHAVRVTLHLRDGPAPSHATHYLLNHGLVLRAIPTKRAWDAPQLPAPVGVRYIVDLRASHPPLASFERQGERRPVAYHLATVTVDGCLGDVYWWLHAFVDACTWQRVHWDKMDYVLQDFVRRMDYLREEGRVPASRHGDVKLGAVVAGDTSAHEAKETYATMQLSTAQMHHWRSVLLM